MVAEKVKKPPPLPVSTVVDTMKKAKPRLLFPAVQFVCVWALLTACVMAGASIYNIAHQSDPVPNKVTFSPSCRSMLATWVGSRSNE